MKIEHPEAVGFAIGALVEKLQQLQVIHLGAPTYITGMAERTKIILNQMEPYVGFLAEQCGWSVTSGTDDSSDRASS